MGASTLPAPSRKPWRSRSGPGNRKGGQGIREFPPGRDRGTVRAAAFQRPTAASGLTRPAQPVPQSHEPCSSSTDSTASTFCQALLPGPRPGSRAPRRRASPVSSGPSRRSRWPSRRSRRIQGWNRSSSRASEPVRGCCTERWRARPAQLPPRRWLAWDPTSRPLVVAVKTLSGPVPDGFSEMRRARRSDPEATTRIGSGPAAPQ